MSATPGPVFIDTVHAAEILQISQDTLLDWIASGRLTSVGGKTANPFLRSAQVFALREEIGVQPDQEPKRTKSATARVQTRLTADARWSDITDTDLVDWVKRSDPSRRRAARTAARAAQDRLNSLLRLLDETG